MKYLIIMLIFFTSNAKDVFSPVPEIEYSNLNEYRLGQKLFYEKMISRDNNISCATCHNPLNYGVDNKRFSTGANGIKSNINTPSIYNLVFNKTFFIDGRANTLKGAVKLEIENSKRFDSSWHEVVEKLKYQENYREAFRSTYSSEVTSELIVKSLTAYVSKLVLRDSKFDRYLRGEVELDINETKGLKKFKRFGCFHCHGGVSFGGYLYSKRGEFYKIPERETVKEHFYGRYNETKNERDLYKYKVLSLRNIEFTAPYFYFGEVGTLAKAVEKKIQYQLGINPSRKDISEIVKFLKTLSAPNIGEKYAN
jgi:cytochrome c peroxidase